MVMAASIRVYRDRRRVNQLNPHLHNVPLQIAAERGPAGARGLALVHRRAAARLHAPARDVAAAVARRPPALACVVAMLAAGHVRIQFRRLRVPDAVPAARHAALRRRSARRPARRAPRAATPDAGCDDPPIASRGRSVLVVGDLMLDHFVVGCGRPHLPGSAGAGRPLRRTRIPARRRRQRRAQHRRAWRRASSSSAWSARTTKGARLREALDRPRHRHHRDRQRRRALHDPQAARRHDAQPAGGADRLRERRRVAAAVEPQLVAQVARAAPPAPTPSSSRTT